MALVRYDDTEDRMALDSHILWSIGETDTLAAGDVSVIRSDGNKAIEWMHARSISGCEIKRNNIGLVQVGQFVILYSDIPLPHIHIKQWS